MRIDHVIIGARTVEPVRDWLRGEYGFGLVQGSAHADGTQGWLVPFDTPDVQYIEVLTWAGDTTQANAAFGRRFLERTAAGPAFLNWAVLTDDIGREAARVRTLTGRDPQLIEGESVRADGTRSPWAEAAFELSWRYPCLPFFLRYGNPTARAARIPDDLAKAGHNSTPVAYRGIRVRTRGTDLAAWLGTDDLPVTCVPGDTDAVESVSVATVTGDVTLALP